MYVMNIVLAKTSDPNTYGIIAIGLAWGLVSLGICSLGFNLSSVRFVAAYLHSEKLERLKSFIRYSIRITIRTTSAGACLAFAVWSISYFSNTFLLTNGEAFLLAIPLVLALPFLELTSGIQRGFNSVIRALIPYNLIFPSTTIVAIFSIKHFSNGQIHLTQGFTALYAGAALALLMAGFFLHKKSNLSTNYETKPPEKEWLNVSLGSLPTALVNTSIRQIDAIILSFFVRPDQIALYWIAGRITRFSSFGLQAAHMVASPQFARLKEDADTVGLKDIKSDIGHRQRMQDSVAGATRATAVMAIPSIILIAIAAPFLLRMAGSHYEGGLTVLYIILIGEVINVACGPNSVFMNMTGLQNQLSKIVLAVLALYVPLIIVGSMIYGILGAAVAVCVTTAIQNFAASGAVMRAFGVNTTMFSRAVWRA